jgi:hypothetical protein
MSFCSIFLKPNTAFVGKPFEVDSCWRIAKKARYTYEDPSTR